MALYGSMDLAKANPPEAPDRGTCQDPRCGNELGDEAYAITLESGSVLIYHPECCRIFIQARLDGAKDFQLGEGDWLPFIETAKFCDDCDRFACWCL